MEIRDLQSLIEQNILLYIFFLDYWYVKWYAFYSALVTITKWFISCRLHNSDSHTDPFIVHVIHQNKIWNLTRSPLVPLSPGLPVAPCENT